MAPSRRRAPRLGIAVAVVAVVLSACGTPRATDDATRSASAPQPTLMMPSANDYVTSVTRTRDLSTADVVIDATITVGGEERALHGEGTVALDPGYGVITWQTPSGAMREIVNDKGNFLQLQPPDGMWTFREKSDPTPTRWYAHALKGVGTLDGLSVDGTDEFDGVRTTRYTGLQRVDPAVLRELGLSDEQVTAIGDAWQGSSVFVTVWVDGSQRVVRIDRSFEVTGEDGTPVSVTVRTELSDFNADVDLDSPPSQSVTDAPEGQ